MRVLYSGGTICNFDTLKRLVLLADEIAFMDRPSVSYGNFGTIGHESEFRQFKVEKSPVTFSVFRPPEGSEMELYIRYIEADLSDKNFIRTVFNGLKNNLIFQKRLVQLESNYGWGSGRQILNELLKDITLLDGFYGSPTEPSLLYVPDTSLGRRQTFSALLIEASIQVTNALMVSEASQFSPVSDDPYFCYLIALRTSDVKYVSKSANTTSNLGLAISESVLPDEFIAKLSISDLLEYRSSAKETYEKWSIEVEFLAQSLLEISPDKFSQEVSKLIIAQVRPRMLELKSEMEAARDLLFGDITKSIAKWEVPTLSIAYVSGLNIPTAIAAFASALVPVVPSVVDYFLKRRNLMRKNSMAYLVGVSKL